MAVIDGPGGPTTTITGFADEEPLTIEGLLAHSPRARQAVLETLTTRLRQKDLELAELAARWSEGVEDELLD